VTISQPFPLIPIMKTYRTLLSALVVTVLLASALRAQVSFTGAPYKQDFDSLPSFTVDGSTTTSVFTFSNNSTLPGWYSSVGTGTNAAVRSAGAAKATGDLYDWGSSGDTDRALGLFSSAGYSSTAYLGLQLRNDSGATIDTLTLTFDVEQWRRNVNATTWAFSYLETSASGDQLTASGYTSDVLGNAVSPVTGSAGGSNGNANVTPVSVTLTGLNWQAGDTLWLRWASDQGEKASGLGLDNLSVSLTPIPEPRTVALAFGMAALGLVLVRRRAGLR